MSLVHLSAVCSHLQNASKARLSTTSVPLTKLHLRLAAQLQKSGFVSSVAVGGPHAPQPSVLGTHPSPVQTYTRTVAIPPGQTAAELAAAVRPRLGGSIEGTEEILASTPAGGFHSKLLVREAVDESVVTQANVASRRVWLGLKYWDNRPVLEHMRMVSKPTRRIWMGVKECAELARGRDTGMVKGLRQVGECMYLTTDRGILEIRECVERGLGGMVLCRVW